MTGRCGSPISRLMALPAFSDIEDNLAFLDDWEDRYRYIIELGRLLPPLPEEARIEANKVRGCASQVWLTHRAGGQGPSAVMQFDGDSDAHIVKVSSLWRWRSISGKTAAEASALDAFALFERFGLKEHLSSQRSNGFRSLIDRIRSESRAVAGL